MKPINYRTVARAGTFIHDYVSRFDAIETARAYDFWCAVWLLSVAVGRCAYVDRPRTPVYFNQYTILVADSGVTRKSTAVAFAQSVVRKLCEWSRDIVVIEGKTTPEQLEEVLLHATRDVGSAQVAFSSSELVTVLGRESYMRTMPGLLTDLFDSRSERPVGGTLGRGGGMAKDVYVSFLSASTPAWLLRAINPDVIEGGFTSRCLFVVEEKPKRQVFWPITEDTDDAVTAHEALARTLHDIRQRARVLRTVQASQSAVARASQWYRRRSQPRDAFGSSFYSREDAHVLRVAGLLAVNDGVWEIQVRHVAAAIQLVDDVRRRASGLFAVGAEGHRLVAGVQRVVDRIVRSGGGFVSQSELTIAARPYMNGTSVRDAMAIMHEMGFVVRFDNARVAGVGAPRTLYRATEQFVRGGDVVERVMRAYGG